MVYGTHIGHDMGDGKQFNVMPDGRQRATRPTDRYNSAHITNKSYVGICRF